VSRLGIVADLVVSDGIGYKRRNPWGVWLLGIVTLGVYIFVWYYKTNNELDNYGETNNPTTALLAITIGWFIIVPPFVSYYRTAERIMRAQERSGATERMVPVLSLLLWFVHAGVPFALPYNQSQLNKVWDALAASGAEVRPA
jgi:drug/metabolite transporter (DMT)-like permease